MAGHAWACPSINLDLASCSKMQAMHTCQNMHCHTWGTTKPHMCFRAHAARSMSITILSVHFLCQPARNRHPAAAAGMMTTTRLLCAVAGLRQACDPVLHLRSWRPSLAQLLRSRASALAIASTRGSATGARALSAASHSRWGIPSCTPACIWIFTLPQAVRVWDVSGMACCCGSELSMRSLKVAVVWYLQGG